MKRLALLLVLAATAGGVTGCGNSEEAARKKRSEEFACNYYKPFAEERGEKQPSCEHPAVAAAEEEEHEREHPAAAKAQEEEANG